MKNAVLTIIIGVVIAAGFVAIGYLMEESHSLNNPAAGAFAIAISLCFIAMAILNRQPPEKKD